mmetsp:Transcript_14694/g.57648  ORF Transcript_14694/g.57648 Transcript_14694/m.57648 type:complete len:503 (+) Transcript_14694:165-1673(+)
MATQLDVFGEEEDMGLLQTHEQPSSSDPLLGSAAGEGEGGHEGGGHQDEASRLELLSDAVFSIIATIGILPVMESLKEEDVPEFGNIVYYVYIYMLVFFIVAVKYRIHCTEFSRAAEVGGVITILNFTYLGLLALYPFLTSLLVEFPDSPYPPCFNAIIFCCTETVYILLSAVINWSSKLDRRTGRLYVRVTEDTASYKNFLAAAFLYWLEMIAIGGVMFGIAWFSPALSFSFYLSVPVSHRLFFRLTNLWNVSRSTAYKSKAGATADPDAENYAKSKRRQRKADFNIERSTAFTDGIFAISVTLVAVNIRAPEGEESEDTATGWEAFEAMLPQFASFVISFALLTYFWYWNSILFKCGKAMPVGAFWFNCFSMLFVGLMPAAVEVMFAYEFEGYAMGLAAFVLLSYSLFQYLTIAAMFAKTEFHKKTVHLTKTKKRLMYTVPLVQGCFGAVALILSFFGNDIANIFALVLMAVPFLVISVVFFLVDIRLLDERQPGIRLKG